MKICPTALKTCHIKLHERLNKDQRILIVTKVAKFRQIWSHFIWRNVRVDVSFKKRSMIKY